MRASSTMELKRCSSDAVVSSTQARPRSSQTEVHGAELVTAPTLGRAGSTSGADRLDHLRSVSGRGPALLVGRGFYTPDVVRPKQVGEGGTPDGFRLEGGAVQRDNLPDLADLKSLSLLPLKLGKKRSGVKARLTSLPSVGSITRLELSDVNDQAAESKHRASAAEIAGSTHRLEFPHHGPPSLSRGWSTPDGLQPSTSADTPDGLHLDASPNHQAIGVQAIGVGFSPMAQSTSNRDPDAASSGDERFGITLAGPPIVEEPDSDFVGATQPEPVPMRMSSGQDAASGMRRNAASMTALNSMLMGGGDSYDGGDQEPEPQVVGLTRLGGRLLPNSQQSLQSDGTFSPSSSGGELYVGSDDDSPGQVKTNMTRRTASGTDIHYVSFWEGHGGGHLIREDSYQFASTRRREQANAERDAAAAKNSYGPLMRFLKHDRHKNERHQRKAERIPNGGTDNDRRGMPATRGTAVGAPVHEASFSSLPDHCILQIVIMLEDVKDVVRCGAVSRKLHKLHVLASASYFTLTMRPADGRPAGPGMKPRSLGRVIQGCLQHGVTHVDFGGATMMSSRLIAQLGDPQVLANAGRGLPSQTAPVVQFARRLQHLVLANNSSLTSLAGLEAAVELRHLVLRGCNKLANIQAITPLAKLQTLDLTWCEKITDLGPLGEGHTALTRIELTGCESIKTSSLLPLTVGCPKLEVVRLGGLEYLGSLDLAGSSSEAASLHCWPDLKRLYLNGCSFLSTLSPLGNKLVLADLSFCQALDDTSWLSGCSKLEHLNLAHCTRISSLDGCLHCPRLTSIGLWGCVLIKSLNPLAKCHELKLVDCTAMVRTPLS